MQSPIEVSYLADTVIMLRHFETNGRLRKAISVLKKRTGAHETTIRELFIGPSRVSLGPALERFHGILTGTPRSLGVVGVATTGDERDD